MSVTDSQDQGPSEVSRRTLIKASAGAGVAVAVVGGAGVAAAAVTDHAEGDGYGKTGDRAATAHTDHPQVTGALVAYVTDLSAGTVEVFSNDARTQVTDRDLAARIARAAQK